MITTAEIVQAIMDEHNCSPAEVSEMMNVSVSTVRRWLKSDEPVSTEIIKTAQTDGTWCLELRAAVRHEVDWPFMGKPSK